MQLPLAAREGDLSTRVRELLRHVDALWADGEATSLLIALAAALEECEPGEVDRLQRRCAQLEADADQLETRARQDGWEHGLEVARECIDMALRSGEDVAGAASTRNRSVGEVLDLLDHDLERAGDAAHDEYMSSESHFFQNGRAATSRKRPAKVHRAAPSTTNVAGLEHSGVQVLGAGKLQRHLVAYIKKMGSATQREARDYLQNEHGVKKTGAYNALRRAVQTGLLESSECDRLTLGAGAESD